MEHTNVQLFEHEEFGSVRVVMIDGEPWFVAVDVCRILEISNSRDAVARLDDDEKADVGITDTSSNGVQQRRTVTAISESGLYALIFTSRKPEAKKFRKWVTHEVLPSIRKTGAYFVNNETRRAFFGDDIKLKQPPTDFERGIQLKKLASHTRNPELREQLILKAAKLIADGEIYSEKRFF